jgi:uncharacterized phage protein (TIGR01671 family)
MREYKFRGKRIDNGEWVYGYYFIEERDIEDGIIWRDIPQIQQRYGDHFQYFDVDLATVGQYTGLPDKNSKESYEHDIVKIYIHNGLYPDEWIAEIVFEKGQFGIRYGDLYKEFYPLAAFFKSTKKEYIPNVGEVTIESEPMFEVIGNPWDNPELLKEGSV